MIISRTPYRFSLIGGGTDLPAYFQEYGPSRIISTTLTASIYVTYTQRKFYSMHDGYDSKIRLSYSRTENVDKIYEIQHELFRATLAHCMTHESFEITCIGDIPGKGAGLGSSSAVIVGLMKAMYPDWDADKLWKQASYVELEMLGKDIGIQDHLAAAFGGCRRYLITSDGIFRSPMPSLGIATLFNHLIAFRLPSDKSSDVSLAEQHDTLVDMREKIKERVPYLKETVTLAEAMENTFYSAKVEDMASILREAWELKKLSHGFIDKDIERWYAIGIHHGALAGKVSGSMSKGAGHLFFLAYPDDHDRIRKALGEELSEFKVEYYPHGSRAWNVEEF